MREECIKVTELVIVIGAKPFPGNQNVKYQCFRWASKYSILVGSVYEIILITQTTLSCLVKLSKPHII